MSGKEMRALVVVLVGAIAQSPESLAGEGKFFSLSISFPDEGLFLFKQRINLLVHVANRTGEPLLYIPFEHSVAGRSVDVRRGSESLRGGGETGGRPNYSELCVRKLEPGESLLGVHPLSDSYPKLPPGEYTVVARIDQPTGDWGLATGETTSNELRLSIRNWRARSKDVRSFVDDFHGEMQAALIETKEGQLLAAWMYPRDSDWGKVVPLGKDLPLDRLLWTVDRRACVVVVPDTSEYYEGHKRRVIVAHCRTGFAESFPLDGGLAEGGITRVPSFLKRAPAEPGTGKPREEKQEVLEGGQKGSASLLVCLFCGSAFGAVVSGPVVWLLMRRKRRAA